MKKDEARELYNRHPKQKKDEFLKEVYRKIRLAALKGEGSTWINFPAYSFDPDEIVKALRENGYEANRRLRENITCGHTIDVRWDV